MSSFASLSASPLASGYGSRLTSPSRLPSSSQSALEESEWSTVAEQRKVHRTIEKITTEEENKQLSGKENGVNGVRGTVDLNLKFEVTRAKAEGEVGRDFAGDYNEARRRTKALDAKTKADEVTFRIEQERDFKRRMEEKRKVEAEERRVTRKEEWVAKKEAKRKEEEEEREERRKLAEYKDELRRREVEIKEKVRLQKVQERRRKVMMKREEKRRVESEGIRMKEAERVERQTEWEKEKAHRGEMKGAKKVKDRVYKNLSRLNEETSLLDIPFGA